MPPRGRPLRPGKPRTEIPAPAKSDHVIHEDGTWSNTRTTVVQKESVGRSLKMYDFIFFGDDSKWQVLEIYEWGLALAAYPRKTMPSMYDTSVYSWDELDSKNIRRI